MRRPLAPVLITFLALTACGGEGTISIVFDSEWASEASFLELAVVRPWDETEGTCESLLSSSPPFNDTSRTLDGFDFTAIPSLNKRLVMELARGEYIRKHENVLAVGNSGTGKTHLAIALALAACHEGHRVRFFTAAGLVTALSEARDDKALLHFQKQLSRQKLIIVDEFGYVPFSKIGAELLFEFFAERYERGSVMVTTNLPFDQWTEVLGSERLTGALLDRLTHRVHILEMNGESYRFKESARRLGKKMSLPKRAEEKKETEGKEKSGINTKPGEIAKTKEKNEKENKINNKKTGEI